MKSTLLVAIIVDPYGSIAMDQTGEDEAEEHEQCYTEHLAPAKCEFYRPHSPFGIKDGTDLVIYDFGGMGLGNSLGTDNARGIINYAREHPDTLIIVVSSFTYDHFIRYEMEELGLTEQANVILDDGSQENPVPGWFLGHVHLPRLPVDELVVPDGLETAES